MEAVTIKQLYEACKEEIKKGNLNKKVLISEDDEGNGFHELFFGFSPLSEFKDSGVLLPYNVEKNMDDYVTLG